MENVFKEGDIVFDTLAECKSIIRKLHKDYLVLSRLNNPKSYYIQIYQNIKEVKK